MKKLCFAIVMLLFFIGCNSNINYYSPQIIADNNNIYISLQVIDNNNNQDDTYELFIASPDLSYIQSHGLYYGKISSLVKDDKSLIIITDNATVLRHGGNVLFSGSQKYNIKSAVKYGNDIFAVNYSLNTISLLKFVDEKWQQISSPFPVSNEPGDMRLLVHNNKLHVFWISKQKDLSSGVVFHAIWDGSNLEEKKSIATGLINCFTIQINKEGKLQLLALSSFASFGNNILYYQQDGNGIWELSSESSPLKSNLKNSYYFINTDYQENNYYISFSPVGISVFKENIGSTTITDNNVIINDTVYNVEILTTFFFFIILPIFFLFILIKRSRKICSQYPGSIPPLFTRLCAYLIDCLFVVLILFLYSFIVYGKYFYDKLSLDPYNIIVLPNVFVLYIYFIISEIIWQTTLGKMLFGLRVCTNSLAGGKVKLRSILIRNILRIVDFYPLAIPFFLPTPIPGLIAIVICYTNINRQRLGDLIAGTVVKYHVPLNKRNIILASQSPRRKELLEALGLNFSVIPANINENLISGSSPLETVKLIAEEKAKKIAFEKIIKANSLIIAADTTVAIDNEVLGKPIDQEDARKMLSKLSGKTHVVYTGIAVFDLSTNQMLSAVDSTEVDFKKLSDDDINAYLSLNESLDKAGGYAIQSGNDLLISQVRGSLSNVIGLPMELLQELLRRNLG